MELQRAWRQKEEELRDQKRETEYWECTIATRERQERIYSNCGHKRPTIETQRKRATEATKNTEV